MVHVVVAIDASEFSDHAFDWYVKNAHRSSSTVTLLHCPEFYAFDHMMSPGAVESMRKKVDKETGELLSKYKAKVSQVKITADFKTFHTTKPEHKICEIASKEKADFIVIGTRGQGKVRRTILGSVSDYVVLHAHCPVLVCPHKKHEKEREKHASK